MTKFGRRPVDRSTAFHAGFNAGYDNEGEANPFQRGTPEFGDWEEGHEMGVEALEDEDDE